MKKTAVILFLAVINLFSLISQSAVKPASTPEEQAIMDFYAEYNKTMFKSQSKLTIMHRKNPFSKLGKEKINGDISGTLSYDAHLKGIGGEVKMIYENYSDFPGWIINGETNTYSYMDFHGYMFGFTQIFDEEGNLKCRIDYEKVEIKHAGVGGGSYGVTFPGKETYWLDWDKVELSPYQ